MLDTIRSSRTASVLTYLNDPSKNPSLSLPEIFYLATVGGAKVMNLSSRIGNFEPSKDFDGILVDLDGVDGDSPIDIFEHDTIKTKFEKWVFLGDDRNVAKVWVKGRVCWPLSHNRSHHT
jgi:guanine deaminase